jgi:acyl-CoA thioester hydrolase
MVTITDRVRFVETDMMGVVHHANYFRWFEMGRVAYLREAGVYLLDLMAEGILFPITDVSCQYRASARFDDEIAIETTMSELTKVRMVFTYRVVRAADGALLATGRTQNAFADEHGKIIRLPAVYFDRLQRLFAQEK